VHIFRHLFVCFQTSVYTLGEFHKNRKNSTVFEELSVSIVDLTVANIRFTEYWLCFALPVKPHLRPSNPQLTPPNSSNTVLLFLKYHTVRTIPIKKKNVTTETKSIPLTQIYMTVQFPDLVKALQ